MKKEKGSYRTTSIDIFECAKKLDASEMVRLKMKMNQLIRRKQKKMVLDLEKTRQVDLAGLGILVERLNFLRSLNGDIKLCNLKSQVSDTLKMVGVRHLMESYGSAEEALASF